MFRVNSLKCATLTAHTRRSVVVPEKRQALSMPAAFACRHVPHSSETPRTFVFYPSKGTRSPGKAAREVARRAGMPQSFPVSQLHPCRSRASAVRTTLVANTTKRAQFLHSVQNAEASPLSLLASCLPVLTLVFPPLSHWQAASLTYCSLFMLLLSLPSLLFESA